MKGSILILTTHELLNKMKFKLSRLNTTNEEWITDACDEILRRINLPLSLLRNKNIQSIIQANGYPLLLKALAIISENDDLVEIIVLILANSLKHDASHIMISEIIIKNDGKNIMENVLEYYGSLSIETRTNVRFVFQKLLEAESHIALSEVKNIQIATKYNITLNTLTDLISFVKRQNKMKIIPDIAHSENNLISSVRTISAMENNEDIIQLCNLMKKHLNNISIQEMGLETFSQLIKECRDKTINCNKKVMLEIVLQSMNMYKGADGIQWKGCFIIHSLYKKHSIQTDSNSEVLQVLLNTYGRFPDNMSIQQISLWALANVTKGKLLKNLAQKKQHSKHFLLQDILSMEKKNLVFYLFFIKS